MDVDRVAGLHLRYFLAVVEHGSVAAAARALHVAQPSVSQQISQLERRLGVRLFERSAHGMTRTPEGERFEVAARTWIRALRSLAPAQAVPTVVGIPRGAGASVLRWVRARVGGPVGFQACTSAAAPSMVRDHRLDAAVVRECSSLDARHLARVSLPSQPLGLLTSCVTADDLDVTAAASVRLDSLAGCRLLWFDDSRASEYARTLLDQVRDHGWEPETYVFDPASDSLTVDALRNTRGLVALRPEPTDPIPGLTWARLAAHLEERFGLLTRPNP